MVSSEIAPAGAAPPAADGETIVIAFGPVARATRPVPLRIVDNAWLAVSSPWAPPVVLPRAIDASNNTCIPVWAASQFKAVVSGRQESTWSAPRTQAHSEQLPVGRNQLQAASSPTGVIEPASKSVIAAAAPLFPPPSNSSPKSCRSAGMADSQPFNGVTNEGNALGSGR